MKNKFWMKFLFLLICLFLASCEQQKSDAVSRKNITQPEHDLAKQTPVVLIHGSGGDEHSMDDFAEKLMNRNQMVSDHLIVFIDHDGKLMYQNKLSASSTRPIISVGFEENGDEFITVEKWSKWLKVLFADLKKQYHFEKIDVVGFSNGGLAIADYAELIDTNQNVPQLRKIVTLGAPFNDTDEEANQGDADFSDIEEKSSQLEKYLANQKHLAENLAVLSIAGDDGTGKNTDSIVPIRSALASRLFFKNQVKVYHEKIISSSPAEHVYLPENEDVLKVIDQFLFAYQLPSKKSIEMIK